MGCYELTDDTMRCLRQNCRPTVARPSIFGVHTTRSSTASCSETVMHIRLYALDYSCGGWATTGQAEPHSVDGVGNVHSMRCSPGVPIAS